MPAYFESGFSVREPMWHSGYRHTIDEYPEDWADARAKAGLTWEPVELQAFALWPLHAFSCPECFGAFGKKHLAECPHSGIIGKEIMPEGSILTPDGVFVPSSDHKAIGRNDTHATLGYRSDEYSTIYHGQQDEFGNVVTAAEGRASMEDIIVAFRGADGSIKFETAGAAREGREVWALLYLDEPYVLPGDDTEHFPFVAVLNRHTIGSCQVVNTQVRVVCWNTFQMASAEGERTGRTFTFRHVGDVASRIEEAKEAIAGLRTETEEYKALAKELFELRVDDDILGKFVQEFLPSPAEHGEVISDRVAANIDKARTMFKHIYLDSVTTDAVRGTGFGLLMASTEYLDHARAFRSPDTYMGRSILKAEPAKAKAVNLVRDLCR